jgi:hypothetical protein
MTNGIGPSQREAPEAEAMGAIGGYLELELAPARPPLYPDALALTSGRACLTAILSQERPSRVWVPHYTCDAAIEPLRALSIECAFYHMTPRLEPLIDVALAPDEMIVYVDYFGVFGRNVARLASLYGERLILDDTQAFFAGPRAGAWSYNSARKFFGVPDGAYLFEPASRRRPATFELAPAEPGYEHLISRLAGHVTEGYTQFQANERQVGTLPRPMSRLSERLLASVDYERVRTRRRANFAAYHTVLESENGLALTLDSHSVPLCYPYLCERPISRKALASAGIFVPTFWPEVLARVPTDSFEAQLANRLLPLPLDQRYTEAECHRVIRALEG